MRARFFLTIGLVLIAACKRTDALPGRIILFDGWSTAGKLHVTGRVVTDPAPLAPDPAQGAVSNAIEAAHVLETDEVQGAVVEIEVSGERFRAVTDDDGRFAIDVQTSSTSRPADSTVVVRARLIEDRGHP